MPQPRKHPTSAARQQAYRNRLVAKRPAPAAPTTADPKIWDAYLARIGLGMSRGSCLSEAPQGRRSLITGTRIANLRV